MLIHPPLLPRKHHGSISLSSSSLSQFLLFFIAITIPTCLVAQVSPSFGDSLSNGILNQYDLLLLTTAAQQQSSSSSSSPAQSVLLVDLSKAHPNRLISLPSLANFLQDDGAEDKPTTTSSNAKNNKGCLRYDHVSGDSSRDLIYFSCDRAIGFLRIRDGEGEGDESGVVYRVEAPGSITELHYFNHTLYWIEDQKRVKSLSTLNTDEGAKDVITTESEKFLSLTLNPSTGVLYYSTWPSYSRTNASIHEFDMATSEEKLLQSGLLLPKSVDSDGEGLYWISHPPGIYFTIEMTRLGSNSKEGKVLVMRQAHQHGGSLAVQCGKVYWTDVVDKRVWVVDGDSGKSVLVSDSVLGANSGLGFLSIGRGGKVNCNWEEHKPLALEKSIDTVLIKKMEVDEDLKRSSNKEKEKAFMGKDSKVQNKGQGMIRLCTRGEAELINCVGDERFCIVFGLSSVPMCLSRQSQPAPTSKTLLQTRLSSTNNSLNPPSTITSDHQPQPRVQSQFESTSWPPEIVATISAISTLAVIMSLISLYMTLRVRSLSRKPIIRRRVVVSRRASESGSGASGGPNNAPASVCEMIDIENCCNMNVCETPCYERTLLQPNGNSTSPTSPNSNGTTTTTTTTVISVNSSNSGSGWNGSSCGKEDKRCLLSI